jgi:hypothetical protein
MWRTGFEYKVISLSTEKWRDFMVRKRLHLRPGSNRAIRKACGYVYFYLLRIRPISFSIVILDNHSFEPFWSSLSRDSLSGSKSDARDTDESLKMNIKRNA